MNFIGRFVFYGGWALCVMNFRQHFDHLLPSPMILGELSKHLSPPSVHKNVTFEVVISHEVQCKFNSTNNRYENTVTSKVHA